MKLWSPARPRPSVSIFSILPIFQDWSVLLWLRQHPCIETFKTFYANRKWVIVITNILDRWLTSTGILFWWFVWFGSGTCSLLIFSVIMRNGKKRIRSLKQFKGIVVRNINVLGVQCMRSFPTKSGWMKSRREKLPFVTYSSTVKGTWYGIIS